MSLLPEIVNALRDELNANTFSVPFTAEVSFLPIFELPEMAQLHVTVAPHGMETSVLDRSRVMREIKVDVAVQQRTGSSVEEITPLLDLVAEIDAFFQHRRLQSIPAVWTGTKNDPVYFQEHLREMGQFTSVLRLAYKVVA